MHRPVLDRDDRQGDRVMPRESATVLPPLPPSSGNRMSKARRATLTSPRLASSATPPACAQRSIL